MSDSKHPRRLFLQSSALTLGSAALVRPSWAAGAPALITSDAVRPVAAQGLQLGDPTQGATLLWSRADRASRMIVEWSLDESFRKSRRIIGPYALEETDFTARQDLVGLPAGRDVFVRVQFQGLDNSRAMSEPVLGRFSVPSTRPRDLRFVWGGDTAGQGWGINPSFGGMKIYPRGHAARCPCPAPSRAAGPVPRAPPCRGRTARARCAGGPPRCARSRARR